MNHLYFGDCLDILLELDREHNGKGFIDLIYIDPPFNSKRNYNVLFESIDMKDANAQKQAFADTWSNVSYIDTLKQLADLHRDLYTVLNTFHEVRSISDSAVAYLTTMAIRIYYMHRLLKDTGSFYLHCDSTMGHYLKLICDIVFGEKNFRNEIIWRRTTSGKSVYRNIPRNSDSIFWYSKSNNYKFNVIVEQFTEDYSDTFSLDDKDGRGPYNTQPIISPNPRPNLTYVYTDLGGRKWNPPTNGWRFNQERMRELEKDNRLLFSKSTIREKYYLQERSQKGKQIPNIWIDIPIPTREEDLGYPTQKPLALLERIISAATDEGDLVADFFCGCGTTIAAAHKLKRNWIGADISHLAVRLILKRLIDSYGQGVKHNIKLHGLPKDVASARMLAEETDKGRFNFQDWVIEVLLNGVHNPKKTADGGYDGYLTFELPEKKEFVLIEVKSGNVNLNQFKSFIKTVQDEKAAIGVFVCFEVQVTKEMERQAKQSGYYDEKFWDKSYPKIQILTIEQLLNNQQPKFPASRKGTFKSAQRKATDVMSKGIFD